MNQLLLENLQKDICRQFNVEYFSSPTSLKVGIALNVRDDIQPINGLRHPPEADSSGWYIWAGEELSDDYNFFQPLHIEHLGDWCPQIQKFLGLPPGWRFIKTGDYEDVWFDESLLTTQF